MTTLLSRFKNVIFRHRYIVQKSSSSIETEQSNLAGFFISTGKI